MADRVGVVFVLKVSYIDDRVRREAERCNELTVRRCWNDSNVYTKISSGNVGSAYRERQASEQTNSATRFINGDLATEVFTEKLISNDERLTDFENAAATCGLQSASKRG